MEVDIDPKLKPLYANLLRLNIEEYLITERFKHLSIENNIDGIWNKCKDDIIRRSKVAILIPGFTGYAREALGIFLMELSKLGKREFINILSKILLDFKDWNKKEKDIKKVKDSLMELGYNQGDLDNVFGKTEVISIKTPLPKKVPRLKIGKEKIDRKLCFVLMPFDEKFTPIYKSILKKAVSNFGLKCIRADEIYGTKPIIEDIWDNIKRARILIADLTERNPNVFYELGLAHALNKKVILITQNLKDVPFDLRHYRCLVYEDSAAGMEKLKEGLKNTLENELGGK